MTDREPTWVERVVTISRAQSRVIAMIVGVLAVFLLSMALIERLIPQLSDPLWVRRQILAFGPWAPVAFILVQTAQVVLAPIPGQVIAFVGGYLFGAIRGTVYSLIGAAIGSAIVFALARRYGRPYVEGVVSKETLGPSMGSSPATGEWGCSSCS